MPKTHLWPETEWGWLPELPSAAESRKKTASPLPPDRDVLHIVCCLVIVQPASFWEAHFNLRSFWMVCCTFTDEINSWWELKVSPYVGCRNTAGTEPSVKRPINTTDRRWGTWKKNANCQRKSFRPHPRIWHACTWLIDKLHKGGTKHYIML